MSICTLAAGSTGRLVSVMNFPSTVWYKYLFAYYRALPVCLQELQNRCPKLNLSSFFPNRLPLLVISLSVTQARNLEVILSFFTQLLSLNPLNNSPTCPCLSPLPHLSSASQTSVHFRVIWRAGHVETTNYWALPSEFLIQWVGSWTSSSAFLRSS